MNYKHIHQRTIPLRPPYFAHLVVWQLSLALTPAFELCEVTQLSSGVTSEQTRLTHWVAVARRLRLRRANRGAPDGSQQAGTDVPATNSGLWTLCSQHLRDRWRCCPPRVCEFGPCQLVFTSAWWQARKEICCAGYCVEIKKKIRFPLFTEQDMGIWLKPQYLCLSLKCEVKAESSCDTNGSMAD